MIRRYTTVATVVAFAASLANPAYAQRRQPAAGHPHPQPAASPAPASPAPAAADASVAEARREYDAGRQAMEAHHADEALRHFQRAYELRSNPVVLVPISQAQTQLEHYNDAIATLQRYLHDRADAPDRAQIEAQITELRHRQPTLHVTSTPAGGQIFVDGTNTNQVTPADITVDPGHHAVRVELAGHIASGRELDVAASARSDVALTLASETATVATTTGPTEPTSSAAVSGPVAVVPPVAVHRAGPNPAVWVATGLGAAGIIAGSVFGIMALNDHADYTQHPTAETRDRGETNALIADISFGVGVLSAAVAIVVWLSSGEESAPAHAALHHAPTGPRVRPAANGLVLNF